MLPAFAIEGAAIPVMTTSLKLPVQGVFAIVQRKVLFPTPNPVINELGLLGETIVPDPPISDHVPVPAVGVLAAIVALELMQTVWSGPAAAMDGKALVVIVTFAVDDVQGKFEIDQVRTVTPAVNPVSVVFATSELVITPGPETFIHLPTPAVGVFPASVTEPVLTHIVWFGPAFAIEGTAVPTIIILSCLSAQGGFVILHRNVLLPTPKPVI